MFVERAMEMKHITGVLEENEYPSSCLESWKRRSLESEGRSQTEKVKSKVTVCLPYVEGLSEKIRRILRALSIDVVFKPQSWK